MTSDSKNRTPLTIYFKRFSKKAKSLLKVWNQVLYPASIKRTSVSIYLERIGKKAKRLLPVYLRVTLFNKKLIEEHEKKKEYKASQELLDDKALTHPDDDEFGRAEFAKRIADIFANRQTPDHLTVGIYGKWGEGKTSLVNFIKHYLDLDKSVVHFDFNPWRYKDKDELLNSFFKQFAQGVTHKLGEGGKKIAKTILAYSGLIVAIAEPITGLAMFSSLEGWGSFKKRFTNSKDFVDDNNFSPVINSLESSLDKSDSLQKQKERISRQLKETGKKHIVFVDDLDRLDKEEIQMLFSLIKVTADFDHVIYVLSFDPKIVANALGETYSESGRSFLDKIVQVPLNLPKARSTDIFNEQLYPGINTVLSSYNFALTKDEEREITDSIGDGLEDRINTPRMVKRYLNVLNFALPILKGDANVHDVIMIEGLRICYPETYEYVFNHRELFVSEEDLFNSIGGDKKEQNAIEKYLKDKDDSLIFLLKSLFFRLRDGSSVPLDEEPSLFQRISSPHYFERYFTYSIPKNDLSDSAFNDFINSLPSVEVGESIERGKEFIELSNEDVFLRKIEENENIKEEVSLKLVLVLAGLGDAFSRRNDLINIRGPISRAASIISRQLKRVSQSKRFSLAKDALESSTNILLMAEIGRQIHNKSSKEPIFTEQEQQELEELVAKLIREDVDKNAPLYLRDEVKRDASLLFNLWTYTPNEDEVENYIIDSFEEKSSNVIEFLKAFTPTRGTVDGKTYYGIFEADEYTKIKRLVSPKIIFDILSKDYSINKESFSTKDLVEMDQLFVDDKIDEGIAKKFAYYYKKDSENE